MIGDTRKTYFSLQDDTVKTFPAFIKMARRKIRIADYSFYLEPLVELLIEKHEQGVHVQLVLDKSQSTRESEKPAITKLTSAEVPFVIGTSSKHQIMHNKFTILDAVSVPSGSWSYTAAAVDEDIFLISNTPRNALKYLLRIGRKCLIGFPPTNAITHELRYLFNMI